jgi:hypothetical protein
MIAKPALSDKCLSEAEPRRPASAPAGSGNRKTPVMQSATIAPSLPAARRAPPAHRLVIMQLREVVEKYLQLSGGYGRPAPLAGFGLPRAEAERTFSALDEDYHISRFFHFSNADGETHQINGFPYTHVTLDAEIQSIL